MNKFKISAFLFLLAAICFLIAGISNYSGRPFIFYGDIIAAILFVVAAIRIYRKSRNSNSQN